MNEWECRLCLAWSAVDWPRRWLAGVGALTLQRNQSTSLSLERRNAGDWDTGSTKNSRSWVKFNQASRDR